jgi:hypothetical protein
MSGMLLPPAQVVPSAQMTRPMMPTSLAASMMGRGGASPGSPIPQIPLSTMLMLMQAMQGNGNQPAISGVNNNSLIPADSSMTAAPNFYAGGAGGPGY